MKCPRLHDLPAPPAGKSGWPWDCESEQLPALMPDGTPWPRISVVTPSYNQGQYLEEALRSLLLQGYPELDYIVIDGGSNDGSVDIVRKYSQYLTYWESAPDRGQSHAINKGFKMATGQILCWLCSDDLFAPNALATVARTLKGKTNTLLIGASVITNGPNTLEGSLDRRRPSWNTMLYEGRSFPQPSAFWTSDITRTIGLLNENLYYAMDYDYWLRMKDCRPCVVLIDSVLSYERQHARQKSAHVFEDIHVNLFSCQRAWASYAAWMRARRPLVLWLLIVLLWVVKNAVIKRKVALLHFGAFQKAAFFVAMTAAFRQQGDILALLNKKFKKGTCPL